MTTAGYVAANRGDGPYKLAGCQTENCFLAPRSWKLVDRKSANLLRSCRERVAHRRARTLPGGTHLFWEHAQSLRLVHPVELRGVLEKSTIAALAHIAYDALHRRQDGVERCATASFQLSD